MPRGLAKLLSLIIAIARGVTDRRHGRSNDVVRMPRERGGTEGEITWSRLESLYRSSRDDVYAYAMTLLRDPPAAEEVTAVAFERAYRRRRTFDRRRGEERAWLFGIARNAALDELRRRQRLARLVVEPAARDDDRAPAESDSESEPESDSDSDLELGAEPGADDGEELLLRRTTVRHALADLSARDRELIALKFHAGLANAEIARILGVSESNAGTILHRAIQKLRKACNAPV